MNNRSSENRDSMYSAAALNDEIRQMLPSPAKLINSGALWSTVAELGNGIQMFLFLRPHAQRLARRYPDDWSRFGSQYVLCASAYVLLRQEKRQLFSKFAMCPCRACQRKITQAIDRRVKELRLGMGATSPTRLLPVKLSQRQEKAMRDDTFPILRKIIQSILAEDTSALGSAVVLSPEEKKNLLSGFASLCALPPGPKPQPETEMIRSLSQKLKKHGKKHTLSVIARECFSDYAMSNGEVRRELREKVRQALRTSRSN